MTLPEMQFYNPHSSNGSNPPAGVTKINPDSLNNLNNITLPDYTSQSTMKIRGRILGHILKYIK